MSISYCPECGSPTFFFEKGGCIACSSREIMPQPTGAAGEVDQIMSNPSTPIAVSDELLRRLVDLRTVARDAQKLAQHHDGVYEIIRALDPVVDGSHEALRLCGFGYMEYPSTPE